MILDSMVFLEHLDLQVLQEHHCPAGFLVNLEIKDTLEILGCQDQRVSLVTQEGEGAQGLMGQRVREENQALEVGQDLRVSPDPEEIQVYQEQQMLAFKGLQEEMVYQVCQELRENPVWSLEPPLEVQVLQGDQDNQETKVNLVHLVYQGGLVMMDRTVILA